MANTFDIRRWSPMSERCPECFEDGCLEPIDIEGDIYYVCRSCDHIVGIDDTMTDDDLLTALIVSESALVCYGCPGENRTRSGMKVDIAVCARCGNDDINQLSVAKCDEMTGRMWISCLLCHNEFAVSIGSCSNDVGETDGMAQVDPFNGAAEDEENWHRCSESDYFPGSDESISEMADRSEVQRSTFLVCSVCDNQEETSFDVQLTDELMVVECHVCGGSDVFYIDHSPSQTPTSVLSDTVESSHVECMHCGNANDDRFSVETDDDGIRWLRLQCLVCSNCTRFNDYRRTPQTSDGDKICDKSIRTARHRQPDKERCRYRQSSRRSRQAAVAIGRERISNVDDLDRLRRGDHIAWHRWYGIWHHAIVVEADAKRRQMTVIHNSGSVKPLNGKIASVRLETIKVDPKNENLYRYAYHSKPGTSGRESASYESNEVVERAASRLGQTYNPITFNCEHFARWCKTGRQTSEQVKALADRVTGAVSTSLNGIGGKSSAAVKRVRGNMTATGLVASIAVESATFVADANEAYRQFRAGVISQDDFRQQLAKTGCESVGGLVAPTACGLIGQLVIPVPFIRAFVGCTLSNLVGRWCGAMIGKQEAGCPGK